ncbi:MAG: dual specificity protein phosphatase family protein, partial [Actinomycetes bacterium]
MYTDEIPSLDPTDLLPARRALTGDPVRDAAVWHRLPCEVHTSDHQPTGLWVGGDLHDDEELAAAQLREWLELGVAHVVDCREERSDQDLVEQLAPWVRYTHVGVDDHGGHQRDEWFDDGVDAALSSLGEGHDVYVHCHMGINRGPSMACAVLLALG